MILAFFLWINTPRCWPFSLLAAKLPAIGLGSLEREAGVDGTALAPRMKYEGYGAETITVMV